MKSRTAGEYKCFQSPRLGVVPDSQIASSSILGFYSETLRFFFAPFPATLGSFCVKNEFLRDFLHNPRCVEKHPSHHSPTTATTPYSPFSVPFLPPELRLMDLALDMTRWPSSFVLHAFLERLCGVFITTIGGSGLPFLNLSFFFEFARVWPRPSS